MQVIGLIQLLTRTSAFPLFSLLTSPFRTFKIFYQGSSPKSTEDPSERGWTSISGSPFPGVVEIRPPHCGSLIAPRVVCRACTKPERNSQGNF